MARAPFQVLVLPWRRGERGFEVAVFHRADYDAWQFVSGGGEDGETPDDAAHREGHEEAGIPRNAPYQRLDTMASIPASWFRAWATWPAHVLVVPEYAFAVEVGIDALHVSDEHRAMRWCSRQQAMALLQFDSNRTALWELNERLFPGERIKRHAYG